MRRRYSNMRQTPITKIWGDPLTATWSVANSGDANGRVELQIAKRPEETKDFSPATLCCITIPAGSIGTKVQIILATTIPSGVYKLAFQVIDADTRTPLGKRDFDLTIITQEVLIPSIYSSNRYQR